MRKHRILSRRRKNRNDFESQKFRTLRFEQLESRMMLAGFELPLDEGSGAFAGDVSGMGNSGVLVGGAAFEANTGDGSPYAVRFDGVNDSIDVGTLDVDGTGLTLAAWFNADSFPGPSSDARIISKASGTAANEHVFMLSTIRVGSAVRLRGRLRVGGSTTTLIAGSGDIAPGVWRHAALTYDGATLRLYLDAAQVGSTTLSGPVEIDPSLPVAVGSQPAGAGPRYFDGLLDDVRIVDRAMSQSDLLAIVNGVNDAPANTMPGPQAVLQDTQTHVAGVSIADVDAGSGFVTTRLHVNNGVLNVTLSGGSSISAGANGTNDLTIEGTVADVNGTLASMFYTGNSGFAGTDTLTVTTDDDGNTGTGGPQQDIDTVEIAVGAGDVNAPPRIVTGTIVFTKQTIDTTVDETHFVVAADLDGDGDIDVVASDFIDDTIFWYENDGRGGFVTRVLDASLDGAYPLHVADVDLDGDVDVLATGYNADTVVWYENHGGGDFRRRDVDTAADGAHSVVTGDIDQDGDVDLLTTNQDGNSVNWYENDGNENFTIHMIDTSAVGAKRAELVDMDNDGDWDVVAASFFDNEIAWYENDGNQSFTYHLIDSAANGAYFVSPTDVDNDGDMDLLSANQLDNTFAWYENVDGVIFAKHVIDNNALGPRSIIAVDIDGDGDRDALGASVDDDQVAWYLNDGVGRFTKQTIDLAADGAYGVFAIDMDHDGDVDVLAASRDANAVAIHIQSRSHQASVARGGTLLFGTTLLHTIDVDDSPADLTYTVTELPDFGELRRDSTALPEGGTFTQDDIDNGRVSYVHNGSATASDGFSFTVADGGEAGVNPSSGKFTINVASAPNSVVRLPFDEGSGTVAGDISGMGNHGTLVGSAAFAANSGDTSPYSVRFVGVDDRIDLGELDVNGSGLTLAAWFNPDSFPGPSRDGRLISKATGVAANDHVFMLSTLGVGSSTRLRGRIRVGGVTTTLIADSGDLATGQWRHGALTYDGVTMRLYLDGLEVGSTPLSGAVDIDPSMPVAVGNQPAGAGPRLFDGRIDDVLIAEGALSATEIADIVVNNAPVNTVPGTQTVAAQTPTVISGVSVADVDAAAGAVTTRLQVSNGVLNVTLSGAATIFAGVNGSSDLTIAGNLTDVNGTLATLHYTGDEGFSGSDTLTVTSDDQGNTGTGGPRQDIDSVPIEVDSANIISDHFNSATVNTNVWTIADPRGDATVNLTGTQLQVSLDAGVSHDLWTTNRNAVRVLQNADDKNFEIEAKFDSLVSDRYQFQGLLAQQDEDDFVRFEVHHDGSTATLFVGTLTNGTTGSNTEFLPLTVSGSIWLRLRRSGDTWTFSYSLNGITFNGFASFTRALTVTQVGLHVGNHGTPESSTPAFTALVDYFSVVESIDVPRIDVWYGDSQSFGHRGQPQTWINILGNTSDTDTGIQSLAYSLNGGPATLVSVAPNGNRRLLDDGDFNIEIPFTDLIVGPNLIELVATANDGDTTLETVTVDYPGNNIWPSDDSIDWTNVTDMHDVVQITDGLWAFDSDGLRNLQIGTDRLAVLGDVLWGSYEITMTATLHSFLGGSAAELGLGVHWTGHTEDPGGAQKPLAGFWPTGSFAWFSSTAGWELIQNRYKSRLSDASSVMQMDVPYRFKVRASSLGDGTFDYRFKYWIDGTTEPAIWPLSFQSDPGDPTRGAVVLIAHRVEATFGQIEVVSLFPPLTANDEYDADEGMTLVVPAAIGLLSNDVDQHSPDDLTAVLLTSPARGTLTSFGTDGAFTYVPDPDFAGVDTFTYLAIDGQGGGSSEATVTLTVSEINDDAADYITHLPLDEGSGTVAGDASGNDNDGTLLNGAAFDANTGDGSPSSVRFDGVDDSVDLGAVDVRGSGLTLAAWFNADSFPGPSSDARLISKAFGTAANDHVFMLSTVRVGSAIRLRGRIRVGGETTTLIASSGNLTPGAWRHAALTYDGTRMRLYLDAVEVGSTALSGAVDTDSSMSVSVGSQPDGAGSRFFDGWIDDVLILQDPLSEQEILEIVGRGP